MTQTITLKIWNEQEGKVTKNVEIENVLNVTFDVKYKEINFFGSIIEIIIFPELNDIEFDFSTDKDYVFLTIKDCEAQ